MQLNQRGGTSNETKKKRGLQSYVLDCLNEDFCLLFEISGCKITSEHCSLCLFDWNDHRNKIIPLKMKNESCVRCKSSDWALLFHY